MSTAAPALPFLLTEVECVSVDRLSPSFVRVALASPELADLGVDGPLHDQRVKLVLPDGDRPLPSLAGIDPSTWATWLDRPAAERGHLRTYTVRALRGEGVDTRLVVDVVVHPGECGPGGAWGARARVGDRVGLVGPRRGVPFGGIEFVPGDARTVLLVGDETAVPAVAAILEQLDPETRGYVFLEVPYAADQLTLEHPVGVVVRWLPREGASRGVALHAAVLAHLGAGTDRVVVGDDEVDPDLWETPAYSSSGEDLAGTDAHGHDGLYAWIAGEARVVTGLRRAMVRDLGIDRRQVAFMGYWRAGVAMRS